jgi:hypothetical protein
MAMRRAQASSVVACIHVNMAKLLRHGDGCGGERRRVYTRVTGPSGSRSTWVAIGVLCMRCGAGWMLADEEGPVPPEVNVALARDRLGLTHSGTLAAAAPPDTQP